MKKAQIKTRVEHLLDQIEKDQWFNVLVILQELSAEALSRMSDMIKGRPARS